MSSLLVLSLIAGLSPALAADDPEIDGLALDDDEILDLEELVEDDEDDDLFELDTDDDDAFIEGLGREPDPADDPPARAPSPDEDLDVDSLLDEDDFFAEERRPRVTAEESGLDDLDLDLGDPDDVRADLDLDDMDDFGDPGLEPLGLEDPDEDLGDLRGFDAELLDEAEAPTVDGREVKLADYGLDMDSARALGDNFEIDLVERGPDAVVVELPVVITARSADYLGEKSWIVARFYVNGSRAGEQRHIVHPTTIAEAGPTIVWIKGHLPVPVGTRGEVEIQVVQEFMDGEEMDLFTKVRRY